jgi:voltage-gated potassium channel
MAESSKPSKPVETHRYLLDANYELFVVGIVIITLVNDLLTILNFDVDVTTVADSINAFLTAFLFFDACLRFFRRGFGVRWFLHGGWLVFLGSVPFAFFGLTRLLRTVWTLRYFRRADLIEATASIRSRRAQSTLLGVLLLAIIGFELAGITILLVESVEAGANIRNASDALWWSYVTIATVGYGDRYPVTTAGRITGAVVITLGIALFSTITSFLSDWFRRPHVGTYAAAPAEDAPADLQTMLTAIHHRLDEKAAADHLLIADLRARLEQIEQRLSDRKEHSIDKG